jgi:hypothetical protein
VREPQRTARVVPLPIIFTWRAGIAEGGQGLRRAGGVRGGDGGRRADRGIRAGERDREAGAIYSALLIVSRDMYALLVLKLI